MQIYPDKDAVYRVSDFLIW